MSAAIAALFSDHERADAARTRFVKDGFPTDRVALTSNRELGFAALAPAKGTRARLTQYFQQIFDFDDERQRVQSLVNEVVSGAAVLLIQPRGALETERVRHILGESGALSVHEHDLGNQALERAAAADSTPLVKHLIPGSDREEGKK